MVKAAVYGDALTKPAVKLNFLPGPTRRFVLPPAPWSPFTPLTTSGGPCRQALGDKVFRNWPGAQALIFHNINPVLAGGKGRWQAGGS
jgi:hypothetical protein